MLPVQPTPNLDAETIVAVATAAGRAGVGIVRLSGARAAAVAEAVAGALPSARRATLRTFRDPLGAPIDRGLVLVFAPPLSYTGEPVVEFHAHGSPVVLELLVAACEAAGARRARPGEFSLRAFLNGRMDLAQAEAVADLIDAGSAQAARAALRSLSGEFSARVRGYAQRLIQLRTQLEAGIDFPDEDLDLVAQQRLAATLQALADELGDFTRQAEHGRLLNDGLVVVIAGRPNAGKSSLLNRLCGQDAAIVSPTPGTTRDVLRERVLIQGVAVELLDTAGLRATREPVEAEGIRRARRELARADHVLYLVDAADPDAASALAAEIDELPAGLGCTVVDTKCDLARPPAQAPARTTGRIAVSTVSGEGMAKLVAHLAGLAGAGGVGEGTFSARARHVQALRETCARLAAATQRIAGHGLPELVAEELRLAQVALGEVTGEFTSEDLLGTIFATFCIGK